MGEINIMENKVLGPMIRRQIEEGQRRGRIEGQQDLLQDQLTVKFGSLPAWVVQRLHAASEDELNFWAKRILRASTFEETFL